MLKKTILILSACFLFFSAQAQDTIKVNLYKTTDDYITKKFTDTNITLVVKEIGKNYLNVKKFIDDTTGKTLKNSASTWAITYNGKTYLNLGYTNDLNNWKLFVCFDIEGNNFCSIFIGDETPNIIKNSGNYYGGGLTGVLLKESTKWGKNWTNQQGQKLKILFINLNKQNQSFGNRNKGSLGYLITRKELKEKLELDKSNDEMENMSFEEAVRSIQEKNKKYL